jgi:hypothetical protein
MNKINRLFADNANRKLLSLYFCAGAPTLEGTADVIRTMARRGIDMVEVGYGHPLIDLGNSFSPMVTLLGDFEQIIGLPQSLARELWNRMIGYYFEGADAVEQAHRIEQIWAISIVRNFSWLALSDSFPEDLIRQCQDAFDERVVRHKDHLLAVCETFGDFSLQ